MQGITTHPLLVIVGSIRAGRMTHLKSLAASGRYTPVVVLTDRPVSDDESEWYRNQSDADMSARTSLDQYLARFIEEGWHYTLVRHQVERARGAGNVPLVGMTMEGFEHLVDSAGIVQTMHNASFRMLHPPIPYQAVVLMPVNMEIFAENVMRREHVSEEIAWSAARQAVSESTIPPYVERKASSLVPLPIYGDRNDGDRLEDLLVQICSH